MHCGAHASAQPRARRSRAGSRDAPSNGWCPSSRQRRARKSSATMLDACMEGIQTCDSAAWSSLSAPVAGSPLLNSHVVYRGGSGPAPLPSDNPLMSDGPVSLTLGNPG